MLRFAPSPTGDMQMQDLRIAIFNYILSIQKNEALLIRIEDIDTDKNIEGKDKEIIGLLDLFGIKYQDVIYQSGNIKHHRTMALSLLHEKIAFNCFCTPATLESKRETAKANNEEYRYDDTCLSLSPEQTIDNENPFKVRIRKPNVDVEFTDLIKGKMSFAPADIDSFIILRADKNPTYNFACAIDDMLSDVSMVIRGEEHLSDTPKQIAARAALNYTKEIEYAHVLKILDEDALSIKSFLEEGYLPEAIINYLILLGNKTPQEIFSLEEAIKWFDLSNLSLSPAKFDIDKLRFINNKQLEALDDVELSRYVGFADGDIGKLAKIYLEEVSTTKELKVKVGSIFAAKTIPQEFQKNAETIKKVLQSAKFFEKFNDFESNIVKETGLKGEELSTPLRLVLSGMEHGPELSAMYPYIKNYMMEIIK